MGLTNEASAASNASKAIRAIAAGVAQYEAVSPMTEAQAAVLEDFKPLLLEALKPFAAKPFEVIQTLRDMKCEGYASMLSNSKYYSVFDGPRLHLLAYELIFDGVMNLQDDDGLTLADVLANPNPEFRILMNL